MREHPLDVTHEPEEEVDPLFCELCSEATEEPTYTHDWRLVCQPCYDMLEDVRVEGLIRAPSEPGEDEKDG